MSPIAINGDGNVTTSQLSAYSAAKNQTAGNQTAQEQATVSAVEEAVQASAQGWEDSGGTGGQQKDVALEVAESVAQLEADRQAAINQWAGMAANGSKRAQVEMHGADTKFLVGVLRLVFELRNRINNEGIP